MSVGKCLSGVVGEGSMGWDEASEVPSVVMVGQGCLQEPGMHSFRQLLPILTAVIKQIQYSQIIKRDV